MPWSTSLVAASLLTGCAFGAGPVVGIGAERGAFYGVEVGGGLMIAQAALAAHSTGELYLRAEATLDVAGVGNGNAPAVAPGARIGGGYAVTGRTGGVFVAGANVNFLLRKNGLGASCSDMVPAALIALDARYVGGEWQLVFAPRIEGHTGICNH